MLTLMLAVLVFLIAAALISIGVVLGKRTPLKGSCGSAGHGPHEPGRACDACTCGAVPQTGVPEGGEIGCGPVEQAPPDR